MSEYVEKFSNKSRDSMRRKSNDSELPDHGPIHPLQKFNSMVGNQAIQRLVQANPGDNRAVFDIAGRMTGTNLPVIQRQPDKKTPSNAKTSSSTDEQESIISTLLHWIINTGKLELTSLESKKDDLRQSPPLNGLSEMEKMQTISHVFRMINDTQNETIKNLR